MVIVGLCAPSSKLSPGRPVPGWLAKPGVGVRPCRAVLSSAGIGGFAVARLARRAAGGVPTDSCQVAASLVVVDFESRVVAQHVGLAPYWVLMNYVKFEESCSLIAIVGRRRWLTGTG